MKRHTIQRTVILDTLRMLNCHASAGMVYEAVQEKYPTISRGTVFRVLSDAAADGEVLRLRLTETDDRFDITTYPHCHITCRQCGYVQDIKTVPTLHLEDQVLDSSGFQIEEYHLELLGICPACQKKMAENPGLSLTV